MFAAALNDANDVAGMSAPGPRVWMGRCLLGGQDRACRKTVNRLNSASPSGSKFTRL